MTVPSRFKYLLQEPLPPAAVRIGLDCLGTLEGAGTTNNPKIVGWADEVKRFAPNNYNNWAADWYNADSIAWCGLFMALCQVRTGLSYRKPPLSYLSALAWASWGEPVKIRDKNGKLDLSNIEVGDICVYVRDGGGHVHMAVGVTTDGKYVLGLGGNQDNAVNIKGYLATRLYAVRRPKYIVKPAGARHVVVSSTGIDVAKSDA